MTHPAPSSGILEGCRHFFPVRVYYEDTDAGGVVYHAAYLRFAERARSEFLRQIGWPHDRMLRESGAAWAVRQLEIAYRRPARLDDALTVTTYLTEVRGAGVAAVQAFSRGSDDLARMSLQLAVLTVAGRPTRIPAELRRALLALLLNEESTSDDAC